MPSMLLLLLLLLLLLVQMLLLLLLLLLKMGRRHGRPVRDRGGTVRLQVRRHKVRVLLVLRAKTGIAANMSAKIVNQI